MDGWGMHRRWCTNPGPERGHSVQEYSCHAYLLALECWAAMHTYVMQKHLTRRIIHLQNILTCQSKIKGKNIEGGLMDHSLPHSFSSPHLISPSLSLSFSLLHESHDTRD